MKIEQQLPNKPNFKLILYLACAAIVLLFAFALVFLKADGRHLTEGLKKTSSLTPVATQLRPA